MMKLGLFGGTFDPIHLSHIALCEACYKELGLDKIILMPTFQPPHKIKTGCASSFHRLTMCQIEAKQHPWMEVSNLEIQRGGASFTADTLDELYQLYPDAQWYLLTGSDMFCTLLTWHRFADIAEKVVFCTVPRDKASLSSLESYAKQLKEHGATSKIINAQIPPYSSTEIRNCIENKQQEWETMVSPAIKDYICRNCLYTKDFDETPTTDTQYIEIIRKRLSDYRFAHSLAVAKEAKRLALLYGGNPDQAYTAGLLHDILKDTPKEEQLQIAESLNEPLDDVEKQSPKLWHAHIGSVFLKEILKIDDLDMINAVRYHTTARKGMSLLEKIVYIADFTAEGRNYNDIDEMRARANQSLEKGMHYALTYTIQDLIEKGRTVHPDTLAAYEEINGMPWKGSK